jgi:S-adenosylmethionine hydrolase
VSVITLTTDFGAADWFVGIMKGVILDIHPRVQIVDLTHEIPAGNIHSGAFALAACYRFFPKKTVHLAVIDPGVGSQRRGLAVQTANYSFVGPDNGILSFALANERVEAVHQIANPRFLLHPVSQTFHGRDVFAPAAAHLSAGLSPEKLGPVVTDFIRLDRPRPKISRDATRGEIAWIDGFGNAITNLDEPALSGFDLFQCDVWLKGKRICPIRTFYQAVAPGRPVALLGSCGFLEIAVNGGSAAKKYRLKVGDPVIVREKRLQ